MKMRPKLALSLKTVNKMRHVSQDESNSNETNAGEVLPNLRDLRNKPPFLDVFVSPEAVAHMDVSSNTNSSFSKEHIKASDHEISSNAIDWNFNTTTDEMAKIDWEIGTIEQSETSGNDMLAERSQLPNENVDNAITWGFLSLDTKDGRIDISIENTSIVVHEKPFNCNESSMKHLSKCPASSENGEQSNSPFLETEYRNKLLDDLFELKAFLESETSREAE